MTRLADRMAASGPRPRCGADRAERLRRRGVEVVDLGWGADFATPAHVKAAAHAAIDADFTRYTANAGAEELRRPSAPGIAPTSVWSTPRRGHRQAGGKQALVNAALALFGPATRW